MFTLTSFSSVVEFLLALFKQQTSECLQIKIIIHVHTLLNTFQPLFIIHVCILLYDGQISSSKDTKSSSHIPCNVTMSIHVPQLCLSSITSSCLGKDNSKPGFCTIDNLHQLDCCPYESNRQHKLFFLEMMDAKGAV